MAEQTYSIGEVISRLRDEFPELTVSKVRFLEGKGLVQPGRSAAGYRQFSDEDLNRIRYILREQRDHFLPLKVIKSKLTAWEHGEDGATAPESGPPPEAYFSTSGVSLTSEEMRRAAGLSEEQLEAITNEGLLAPTIAEDGSATYRDDDVVIGKAVNRLLGIGLEARHLRTIRLAADREADLLRQLVTPLLRHRNPDNRRRAAEALADGAQASVQVHDGIIRARLRRLLDG